jgi:hypothetical protein
MNQKKDAPSSTASFNAKIEQTAQFLRQEVKEYKALKERELKVLGKEDSPQVSAVNSIEQIAKFLRDQVHSVQKKKKRSWSTKKAQ